MSNNTNKYIILAEAFLEHFKYHLIYIDSEKLYYIYDTEKGNWHSKEQLEIESEVLKYLRVQPHLLKKAGTISSSLIKQVVYMVKLISNKPTWPITSPGLVLVENGIINLDDPQKLLEKGPNYWIRNILPYKVDPLTKIKRSDFPAIHNWLTEVTNGNEPFYKLLVYYLQAVIIGRTDLQKYLEIVGPGGTGKSTFINLAINLVGIINTAVTELKQLEGNRFETAQLRNKKLIVITDASKYTGEAATLKAIIGQDSLRIEEKGKPISAPITIKGMVIIASNEELKPAEPSSAIYRRRISVQFSSIPTVKRELLVQGINGPKGEFVPELGYFFQYLLQLDHKEGQDFICNYETNVPSLSEIRLNNIKNTNNIAGFALNVLQNVPILYGARLYLGYRGSLSIYQLYCENCKQINSQPFALNRFGALFNDIITNVLKWQTVGKQPSRNSYGNFYSNIAFVYLNQYIIFNKTNPTVFFIYLLTDDPLPSSGGTQPYGLLVFVSTTKAQLILANSVTPIYIDNFNLTQLSDHLHENAKISDARLTFSELTERFSKPMKD